MHQKWYQNGLGYKNRHLEKNHTKCSKLIFICSIHKHTYEFQHLSTLHEPKGYILYVSTFHRLRLILRNAKNTNNVFVFGGAFSMPVTESPSSSESALRCTSASLSLFFDFCFIFFFSVRFCTTVRFVHSEQKGKIQIIRQIFNDKSRRHQKVYSKCYLRSIRQPIKLLRFRKRNA